MLTLILTFLKTHWQATLIASAVLGVFTTISVQHLELRHVRAELDTCHAENIALEQSNRRLVAAVESQNDAVEALKAAGDKRQKAADKALKAAEASAKRHVQAAARIESAQGSKDDCADLKNLVNDYAVRP